MNNIPNFILKHPKVFGLDEKKKNLIIFHTAPLIDLFNAYSDIVHYMDGEIILILENLIRQKIRKKDE
jgi:hypothetical protein